MWEGKEQPLLNEPPQITRLFPLTSGADTSTGMKKKRRKKPQRLPKSVDRKVGRDLRLKLKGSELYHE